MLLYLTSWQENEPPFDARRSWKGYPFEVLDQLMEEELIDGSRRAKSVWFTKKGEKEARALLVKYGIGESP
ncbi:MAG TPA: transposase [Firmicutes bacterium]|nr:transposase [Bacillota bacterium]